jgi:two-component system, chemotaxis family, response regulator Rcp1
MNTPSLPPVILLIDDNEGDVRLITEAVLAVVPAADVRSVTDSTQAVPRLKESLAAMAPPNLILLDLRMPRKSGLEVLAEIRRDPEIGYLPIVVLTSSEAEQDIFRAYALHANSVVTKPISFVGLRSAIRTMCEFWLGVARLPGATYDRHKRNQDSAD